MPSRAGCNLGTVPELEDSDDPFVRGFFAEAAETIHPPGKPGEPGAGGLPVPRRTIELWEE